MWRTASRSTSAQAQRVDATVSLTGDPSADGIRSTMSPASSPRRGPRRAASAWSQAAAAAARSGASPAASSAPIIPASTSPEPAVASRSSPWSTIRTSPPGAATTVVGPLSSTTAPRSAASVRAAATRSAPGLLPTSSENSPSCGVITVGRPRWRSSGPAPSALQAAAKIPSPSTTTGTVASAISARAETIVASSRPRPGPTTSARNRSRSLNTSPSKSAAGTRRWMTSLRASGSMPGLDSVTRPAPDRAAASAHSRPAPSMPGLPATTRTAPFHLWASPDRCGHQAATSADSTRCWVAVDTSSPMSTTRTSPASRRPAPEHQAGLQRLERDRAIGGEHAGAGLAGQGVDATRDVDREHERTVATRRLDVGGDPVAAEAGAVRGVDHQVAPWQRRGTRRGVDHPDLDPATLEVPRCAPAVVAVVAATGDDDDDTTVRAAEQVERGLRRGPPGTIDQFLDRLGRGRIDRTPSPPA